MKKLLVVGVFLNAALLFAVWREVSAVAQGGEGGPGAITNGDVNGSGDVDVADASYLLNWLFLGGPAPVAIAEERELSGEEMALLKQILPHLSVEQLPTRTGNEGNVTSTAKSIRFTGVNVQVVNGLGETGRIRDRDNTTDPTSVNSLGNLIVGYQELRRESDRMGSHNMVVGDYNNYTSFGGLVIGSDNTISGPYASVSGGGGNTASGGASSVSGGFLNTASGVLSSVSGGSQSEASGEKSSVSGGGSNEATGDESSVSGGEDNEATGRASSVTGGTCNLASGPVSSVSGGGGLPLRCNGNIANGYGASVSGGLYNRATGVSSTVTGGVRYVATEEGQVVP